MNIDGIDAMLKAVANHDQYKTATRTKVAAKPTKGQAAVSSSNETENIESANDPEEYKRLLEELNKALSGTKLTAQYMHDKSTNTIVFKLVDDSGRIIRQIPPDEILKLKAFFRGQSGILFDKAI